MTKGVPLSVLPCHRRETPTGGHFQATLLLKAMGTSGTFSQMGFYLTYKYAAGTAIFVETRATVFSSRRPFVSFGVRPGAFTYSSSERRYSTSILKVWQSGQWSNKPYMENTAVQMAHKDNLNHHTIELLKQVVITALTWQARTRFEPRQVCKKSYSPSRKWNATCVASPAKTTSPLQTRSSPTTPMIASFRWLLVTRR